MRARRYVVFKKPAAFERNTRDPQQTADFRQLPSRIFADVDRPRATPEGERQPPSLGAEQKWHMPTPQLPDSRNVSATTKHFARPWTRSDEPTWLAIALMQQMEQWRL
jgi:hypothetical protein